MLINLAILIEILFDKPNNSKIMLPIEIIIEIYKKNHSCEIKFDTT